MPSAREGAKTLELEQDFKHWPHSPGSTPREDRITASSRPKSPPTSSFDAGRAAAAKLTGKGSHTMKANRFAVTAGLAAALTASFAYASHSWNNYHWARTTSSFTL